MAFKATMNFLSKNREDQRGQATAELVVALVAIVAMVSGFFLISQLGMTSVKSVLAASEQAGIQSIQGVSQGAPVSIRDWNIGNDNMEMSPDDVPVTGTFEDSSRFTGELYTYGLNLSGKQKNFATDLSNSNFFVFAANLTKGSDTSQVDIEDAASLSCGGRTLFGLTSITIENNIYLPALTGEE